MTTDEILGETVATALSREQGVFAELLRRSGTNFVLCGAGMLGTKIASRIVGAGLAPLAFVDRAATLHGSIIEGISICSPEYAVSRWATEALFVVSVFRGAGDAGMHSRIEEWKKRGCHAATSFLSLAWAFPDGILPHFAADRPSIGLSKADAFKRARHLLSDALSVRVFDAQLRWRFLADFSGIVVTPGQYAPNQIFELNNERFLDGGAYDGDTIDLLKGGISSAWAVEPDPDNISKLRRRFEGSFVHIIECALGATRQKSAFTAMGGVSSHLDSGGNTIVQIRPIDDLECHGVTYIKLDIEGAEVDALRGARETLLRDRPILAVAVYHRPEDLWSVPALLADLPNYRHFLRSHENDGFELIWYAVPAERSLL